MMPVARSSRKPKSWLREMSIDELLIVKAKVLDRLEDEWTKSQEGGLR